MENQRSHASHVIIINRLKRAAGHLKSIIRMLEEGKPCAEISNQINAVKSVITTAKRGFIHDHIDHCLGHGDGNDFAEMRALAKLL